MRIETNDLDNTGIGGTMTTTNDVKIAVTAVNDPPVNVVPPAQNAFTQYPMTFSTLTGNAIRITDPDAGNEPGPSHPLGRSRHALLERRQRA